MSSQFKVPSLEEMNKRKNKKAKGKELEAQEEAPIPKEVVSTETPAAPRQSTEMVVASRKRKAVVEVEEDPENVIVKIPHGSTAISDPSSLSKFIKRLFLKEDEHKLTELGPLETSKKATALSYQTMECGLFMQEYVESSQRRMRELEKSNTAVRKENAELKEAFEKKAKRVDEVEKELKSTRVTLKLEREVSEVEKVAYKESVHSLIKEKGELEERLEEICYKAMLVERGRLMKQFLAGEHKHWTPKKWIRELERHEAGISSSDEEIEEAEEIVPQVERSADSEGKVATKKSQ